MGGMLVKQPGGDISISASHAGDQHPKHMLVTSTVDLSTGNIHLGTKD